MHGKDRGCLYKYFEGTQLVQRGFFAAFRIDVEQAGKIADDLALMGISRSALFPDLEGIAKELSETKSDRS